MLGTQELTGESLFKFERRRSSLGLSALFQKMDDHLVPNFSLATFNTILDENVMGIAADHQVDHQASHDMKDTQDSVSNYSGYSSDESFGSVPTLDPVFFAHEETHMLLCDIGMDKPIKVKTEPSTPKAVLKPAVISEHSSGKRKREQSSDDDDDEDHTASVSSVSSSMSDATDTTPLPLAISVRKAPTTPSKRARKDANKCAAVLAAMPKPPRRNRGQVSRLDEITKNMSPERARLEKNRHSAKECRMRKKEYVSNLEKKISEYEEREGRRVLEMQQLKQQLQVLQGQANGNQ